MTTVYQNNLVGLKIIKVESDSHTFYQVWKDGVICKQSESYTHCSTYANDLINEMVESKLQALESEVYWAGQSYLHCADEFCWSRAKEYTQAQINLKQFKEAIL